MSQGLHRHCWVNQVATEHHDPVRLCITLPFANPFGKLIPPPAHAVGLESSFVSLCDFLQQSAFAAVGERKVPLWIAAPKL